MIIEFVDSPFHAWINLSFLYLCPIIIIIFHFQQPQSSLRQKSSEYRIDEDMYIFSHMDIQKPREQCVIEKRYKIYDIANSMFLITEWQQRLGKGSKPAVYYPNQSWHICIRTTDLAPNQLISLLCHNTFAKHFGFYPKRGMIQALR